MIFYDFTCADEAATGSTPTRAVPAATPRHGGAI
jgi:hypothetical protein